MNKISIFLLKSFRKIYLKLNGEKSDHLIDYQTDSDKASKLIYDTLISDLPCMIARFGSTELTCLENYIGVQQHKDEYIKFIKGKTPPWWWESNIINQMQLWSGFFPPQQEKIEQFCELMLKDIPQVDLLGSWLPFEKYFNSDIKSRQKIRLIFLDPYWSKIPWTKALEGKKVLVIHPFASTIESQYKKRGDLFKNNLLPDFELKTIKAVQSIAGEKTEFEDWFEALDFMKIEINNIDFDICLIGAGAYGFPLAAHVKRIGKKGFHMGGSLQLLFGIRGKRWENNYNQEYDYASLVNNSWIKPRPDDKPQNANIVEDACYW